MERRDAIKNLGWSVGAFVATPATLSLLQSCGPSLGPWTPAFLSEDHGKMIRRVVDGFLPGVDEMLSGTEANVHVFLDRYWDELISLEDQADLEVPLNTLYQEILAFAEEEDYEDVDIEQVDAFLTMHLPQSDEDLEAFEEKVNGLYRRGIKPNDFPKEVQVPRLLNGIRGVSIWGYKNSELVGKNVLAYDPIPGSYIGCVDLQETTGGKIWAE